MGAIKRTVNSADADAHKQQFSINGSLLTTISTFVNETYSPPRNLTKSFFRSKFEEENSFRIKNEIFLHQ